MEPTVRRYIAGQKKGRSLVEKIPHDAPVLVIGLGRFGAATAGELDKLGRDVLAVDEDPALVQKWAERVRHTAVLDARNILCSPRDARTKRSQRSALRSMASSFAVSFLDSSAPA